MDPSIIARVRDIDVSVTARVPDFIAVPPLTTKHGCFRGRALHHREGCRETPVLSDGLWRRGDPGERGGSFSWMASRRTWPGGARDDGASL